MKTSKTRNKEAAEQGPLAVGPTPMKKTRGRQKVKLEYIKDESERWKRFRKRSQGLFKKAMELDVEIEDVKIFLYVSMPRKGEDNVFRYQTGRADNVVPNMTKSYNKVKKSWLRAQAQTETAQQEQGPWPAADQQNIHGAGEEPLWLIEEQRGGEFSFDYESLQSALEKPFDDGLQAFMEELA